MLLDFRQIFYYRSFILGSVKREFQSKYLNSLLGVAWTVLQPLSMIVVYTLIFSKIMQAKIPGADEIYGYSIYLCSGVITWGLFSEITSRGQNIFIENAGLIKKLSFPRLCLPVIVVSNALINFSIIFLLFSVFLVLSGNFPGWEFLFVFPLLGLQVLFSVGLGMTLGVLNVFFRDVGQFFSVVLQFWFWLTPVVYPVEILPGRLQDYMTLNPMFGLMKSYQGVLLHGQVPDWKDLVLLTILGCFFCISGVYLFRKHSGDMVDEL
ncbi:ABC transporter permease [Modicisalibacter tunisiensis]|uniref:Transport permease protein n=1 Tax=Modicisalibacter tunisiensis TaxID=390637 RepID=A0ABS7WU50_9GAMM|nr:ABC transporter permease [Modicisalibacter tunisiensis]MBZ9566133.1 ABC transporter permease [Modicisalibacter tunisiensis]